MIFEELKKFSNLILESNSSNTVYVHSEVVVLYKKS